jgi:hypothetical protein
MFDTTQTSDELCTHDRRFTVPGYAMLEGFAEISTTSDGVDVGRLTAGDLIHLRTLNSEYRIVLLDPAAGRVTVEGGQLFPVPTTAVIRGSGCGGAMLRVGWIGIGLQLELDCCWTLDQPSSVITSPIEGFLLERTGQ